MTLLKHTTWLGLALGSLFFSALAHPASETRAYTVSFKSSDKSTLNTFLGDIKKLSICVQKQDAPPKSRLLLKKRAKRDQAEITQFLRAQGYYATDIQFNIGTQNKLRFTLDFGPQYVFDEIHVVMQPSNTPLSLRGFAYGNLSKGNKALAATVVKTESALLAFARNHHYALAKLLPRKIWVKHQSHTMAVEFNLNTGPLVKLGPTTLKGYREVDEDFIRKHIAWRPGDPYDSALLKQTNQALLATGLFTSVQLKPAKTLNANGELPIVLEFKERKFRTIGAGVELNTSSGLTLNSNWAHRNYFGAGEKLTVEAQLSTQTSFLSNTFRKPDLWHRNETLILNLTFITEDTEAFEHDAVEFSAALERKFNQHISASLGLEYSLSQVTDESTQEAENFGLISLPATLDWDYSNSLLNPTEGGRLALRGAPTVDTLNTDIAYLKGQLTMTHYWPILATQRLILANRLSLGFLTGVERDDLPADERFYAGGGGSIRGYGFQLAGPLDAAENPLGGKSLFELSVEIRYNVWQEIGVVAFIDTGSVYEKSIPELNDLFTGIGVGLRYSTIIGPLRFDLAFPTRKREGIDDDFQIYISIGQAY